MDKINKTTTKDALYAAAKAGFGSIPVIGSAASELFGLLVTPPLESRRARWMNDVSERLNRLGQSGKIDLTKLATNDQFIDSVLQATTYALKTSDERKIEALKNAIVNTALEDAPEKTISHIFLSLIDAFTGLHIKVLHLFDNPDEWFRQKNMRLPNYMSASLMTVIAVAYPDLEGQRELLDLVWDDLKRAGLHNSGSLNAMMTGSGLMVQRTTTLGRQFLQFIQETK